MKNEEELEVGYLFFSEDKEERHLQQFKMLLEKKYFRLVLKRYKAHKDFDSKIMLREIKDIREHLGRAEEFDAFFKKKWAELRCRAKEVFSIKDAIGLLKNEERPVEWAKALQWYVLTGEIKSPFSANKVHVTLDETKSKVILELSADAGIRDVKRIWKDQVQIFQELLPGHELKKKHKINFDKHSEQREIAKDIEKNRKNAKNVSAEYDNVSGKKLGKRDVQAGQRLKMVDKYNPEAFDKDGQKKEEARQRKIYSRYKRHI
jgi:hypothetical protein